MGKVGGLREKGQGQERGIQILGRGEESGAGFSKTDSILASFLQNAHPRWQEESPVPVLVVQQGSLARR